MSDSTALAHSLPQGIASQPLPNRDAVGDAQRNFLIVLAKHTRYPQLHQLFFSGYASFYRREMKTKLEDLKQKAY